MAITTEQTNFLVSLYVGYFDRAPDPAGFQFWIGQIENGRALSTISADFAASQAAKTLYPFLVSQDMSEVADFISSIYQNLFNTAPDADGLAFWKGVLEDGSVAPSDLIEEILKGATGSGKQALANKVIVAKDFVDTAANKSGFEFDKAAEDAAKDVIDDVTDEAATVTAGETKTDVFFGEKDAGAGDGGSTVSVPVPARNFHLTVGADAVFGSIGDDVIHGKYDNSGGTSVPTYTAADTIDGGVGFDTLKVVNQAGSAFVDVRNASGIKNVEALDVAAIASVGVLTKGNIETVTAKSTSGSNINIDDYAAAADQNLKIVKIGAGSGSVDIGGANATDIEQLWLNGTDRSVSITANPGERDLTVAVDGVRSGTIGDDQATGVKINASGEASTLGTVYVRRARNVEIDAAADVTIGDLDANTAETIAVTGGNKVTVSAASSLGALKSIDASANTGGIKFDVNLTGDIQVTGGSGADTIDVGGNSKDIAMGAGDDSLALSVASTVTGKLDGGDGIDTLIMSASDAANVTPAFGTQISNFETLGLRGGTGTVDMANFGGITDVTVVDPLAAGNLTLNNVTSGATITYLDNLHYSKVITTTVNVKDAASGTADVLNVKISDDSQVNIQTITADNVETVNFITDDTKDTGTLLHSVKLDGAGIKTITVAGDASLRVHHSTGQGVDITTFDASAMTAGSVHWTAGALTGALTAKGSAGDDLLSLRDATAGGTVDLGSGNDSVSIKDQMVVTGGDGDDTFSLAVPTNGNSYSTIQDFTSNDRIYLPGGFGVSGFSALGASLGNTADFQDYLDAAVAGGGTREAKWFQYDGDTYVTIDHGAGATFENGTDFVVKLAGLIDMSHASVVSSRSMLYLY